MLASATMSPGRRVPPLPPPRPVPPPPTLPSPPPVVGLDRDEASEEEDRVKDRDGDEERGDNGSKKRRKRRKVVDWGNSESVSSGANSDGPENGTRNLTAFLTLETEVFGECRSKLKTKGSTLEIWGGPS